MNLLS